MRKGVKESYREYFEWILERWWRTLKEGTN